MRRAGWIALAMAALVAACDLLSTAPSSGGAGLRISLDIVGTSSASGEKIVSQVHRLTVTFTRPDGRARDTTVSIQNTTHGVQTRVRLLPEELVNGLEIKAVLRRQSWGYYAGTTEVDAGDGMPPTVTVVMKPLIGKVAVSPTSANFDAIGDTLRMKAAVLFPGVRDTIPGLSPTWTSRDSTIVAVTPDGLATAKKNGDVVLDATYGNSTTQMTDTVEQVATRVTIVPHTATLVVGSSARFAVNAWDRNGIPLMRDISRSFGAVSPSGALALTPSGLALGMAAGSVTIVVQLDSASDTAFVTVTAAPTTGLPLVVADSDGIRFGDLAGNRTPVVVSGRTSQPTWSADRTHFAYVLNGQLWISDLDGNTQRLGSDSAVAWPEYSADGSFIYYGSGSDIYRIHPDGSGRQLVVQNGSMPTTSPDGSRIAWIRGDTLMVQEIGGSPEAIDVTGGKGTPAWSPDGTWIAYLSGAGDVVTLIHPDGTGRRTVPGTGLHQGICWSPDGHWVIGFGGDAYPAVADVTDGEIIGLPVPDDENGPWSEVVLHIPTAAWWR